MANVKQLPRTASGNFDLSRIRETRRDLVPESESLSESRNFDERTFRFTEFAKEAEELRSLQLPDAGRLVAGLEGQAVMSVGGIGPSSHPSGLGRFHDAVRGGRVAPVVGASGTGFNRQLLDEQRSAEIRAEVMESLRSARAWYTDADLSSLSAFASGLKQEGYAGQSLRALVGKASESIATVRQGNHPELSSDARVTTIGHDTHANKVQVCFAQS